MQSKQAINLQKRALMIRTASQQQLTFSDFKTPFDTELDHTNRWVRLSQCIPWDTLAEAYYQSFSATQGRPAKPARLMIGAVIIKHKLCLSDEETVKQIQENPYLQYFVGLPAYQTQVPFVPSLLVEVRRRMGADMFERFHQGIVDAVAGQTKSSLINQPTTASEDDQQDKDGGSAGSEGEPCSMDRASSVEVNSHQGKLIIDATVAEQAIRYPTDLSLLNEARQISESLIDQLHRHIAGSI